MIDQWSGTGIDIPLFYSAWLQSLYTFTLTLQSTHSRALVYDTWHYLTPLLPQSMISQISQSVLDQVSEYIACIIPSITTNRIRVHYY